MSIHTNYLWKSFLFFAWGVTVLFALLLSVLLMRGVEIPSHTVNHFSLMMISLFAYTCVYFIRLKVLHEC
jgi:hypothetical protein